MSRVAFLMLAIAIVGMLALNLWVAVRSRQPFQNVIASMFSRTGGYSPIERRLEQLFECILAVGVIVLVAGLALSSAK